VSESIIDRLLTSSEPSVQWFTRSRVVGERVDSPQMHRLRDDVVRSPLVRRLLAGRKEDGRVVTHGGPYAKWRGATSPGSRKSLDSVEWGDQGTGRLNEWLTVDALAVLQVAGRLRS
jgi:hypothetical protein